MRISSLPAAHAPVMLACAAASAPAATDADLMKVRRVTGPAVVSRTVPAGVSGIVPWSSLAIAASVCGGPLPSVAIARNPGSAA